MVFRNFRVIMRYNHSVSYALAVSLLAQRIQGRGHIRAAWPVNDRPLNVDQKRELQQRLAHAGYYRGEVDGRIGSGTRRALRKYQRRQGVAPDGYPSLVILRRLRGDG
jgi:membrane-bound lytic murein transglycosylase B